MTDEKHVTQAVLLLLDRLACDLKQTTKRLKLIRRRYDRHAQSVIRALFAGAGVDVGPRVAAVKTFERRIVAWRKQFEAKLGKDEALRVVSLTAPKLTHQLVISRRTRRNAA